MRLTKVALASFLLVCGLTCRRSFGQHGSAESGYYPSTYTGDTFSGKVSVVDDASRQITLEFAAPGKKSEKFVGVIEDGYLARWKDGSSHALKASDFPIGTQLKVYYLPKEIKVDGKKTKINSIFQVKEAPNLAHQYSYLRP